MAFNFLQTLHNLNNVLIWAYRLATIDYKFRSSKMSFDKIFTTLVITGAMLSLTACCETSTKCTDEAASIDSSSIAPAAGLAEESLEIKEEAALLDRKVLYFGYNSHGLAVEDKEIIAAHAKSLLENPSLRLRVVGHTDERGTRAYNVALGKLRAKAVARELELKGVPANRITVISYGKKRPIATTHNKQAWSQNRRAELIYETQN